MPEAVTEVSIQPHIDRISHSPKASTCKIPPTFSALSTIFRIRLPQTSICATDNDRPTERSNSWRHIPMTAPPGGDFKRENSSEIHTQDGSRKYIVLVRCNVAMLRYRSSGVIPTMCIFRSRAALGLFLSSDV